MLNYLGDRIEILTFASLASSCIFFLLAVTENYSYVHSLEHDYLHDALHSF